MLQDLDERRATSTPTARLPSEVRLIVKAKSSRKPLWFGIGGLILLQIGMFVWLMPNRLHGKTDGIMVQAQVVSAPVASMVSASVIASEPAAIIDVPTEEMPSTYVTQSADFESVLDASLKASINQSKKPMVQTLPAKMPRNAVVLPASKPVSQVAVVVPSTAPAEVPAATPTQAAMTIEKSPSLSSARERADSEYRKAQSAQASNKPEEAMENLRAALKHDATHSMARQQLFKLQSAAKQFDDAAETLRAGIQIQPTQPAWPMALARLRVEQGDIASAWQVLQHSMSAAGAYPDYQGFSAHVLQRLGRDKEAIAHFQTAIRQMPNEGRWWLGLAMSLDASGRSDEAREAWMRAKNSGNLNKDLLSLVEKKLH